MGIGVAGLAGCLGGDGDGNGEGGESGDDEDDAANDADGGSEGGDGQEKRDSDDEEGEESDAIDGSEGASDDEPEDHASAEITFLGETHTSSGSDVGCFDGATEDVLRQLVATFESDRHVGLIIRTTFYDDDTVRVSLEGVDVSAVDADHEGSAQYVSELELDEIAFDVGGEEDFASGAVDLEPYNPVAHDGSPEGIEVEFDVRC